MALTLPSCRSGSLGRWRRAARPGDGRRSRTGYTGPGMAAAPSGESPCRTPYRNAPQGGALHYGKQGRCTSSRPVFLPRRLPNQPLDTRMKALKLLRPGVPGAVVDAGISLSERPGNEKARRFSLIDDGNGFFQVNPPDSMLLHQFMHCLSPGLAAVSRAVLTWIFTSAPARALGTAVMPMALIAVENFTAHCLPPPIKSRFLRCSYHHWEIWGIPPYLPGWPGEYPPACPTQRSDLLGAANPKGGPHTFPGSPPGLNKHKSSAF